MAASGKKGKTKWKPVDTASVINTDASRKLTTGSWADETSNDLDDTYDYGGRKSDVKVSLPTAPRAARGAENDANIPKEPPFQAYLSNLSYEVTEEDLTEFFADMKVKNVRLPRDDRGNTIRAKGFGYVEFEDRNSLIEALSMPDTTCKNRRMRIEVAENGDQGRGGRGGMRDRGPSEPDRTMGDWRSGPRTESEPQSDRDGYRSGPRRDFGSDRGGSYGDRDRRGGGFREDDRDRGFRSRDGDRPSFRDGDRPSFRDGDRPSFRDGDRPGFGDSRGGGFRDDRGGGFRDSGGDRYERRGYDDRRGDRGGDRGTSSTWRNQQSEPKERERDAGPPPDRGEPKTRTRLNLQPRSRPTDERVSNEEVPAVVASPAQPAAPAPTASIFGQARPVDTAAREREIEERLSKQREDRPPPSRDESRTSQPPARDPPSSQEDAPPSPPPLEPAPPPKENVWSKRNQQTPSQVNNGRISPHEDGESHKQRDSSPSNEPRKYQPPRRNTHDERRRDERGLPRGGGAGSGGPRGGGARNVDTKPSTPPKPREHKKEPSDETIRMPKVQEHQAPNFVGSNKYAFLEDSESAAD